MPDLTAKQRAFVDEYLVDLNATQAAIRAGYSRKTAAQVGAENLRKPYIAEAVEEAKEGRAERTRVSADKVVAELAKLGFSDMRELASWDEYGMRWKESRELSDEAAASVRDVSVHRETRREKNGDVVETVNTKLVLHDKLGALRDLAKHLGLFPKDGPGVSVNQYNFDLSGVPTDELEHVSRLIDSATVPPP